MWVWLVHVFNLLWVWFVQVLNLLWVLLVQVLNLVTVVIPMPDILVAEKVDNSASGNFINNAIVITTKGKVCEPCLCQPVGLSASECHDNSTDAVGRIQKTVLCCEPDLSLDRIVEFGSECCS